MPTHILSLDDHWWITVTPIDSESLVLQQRYSVNLNSTTRSQVNTNSSQKSSTTIVASTIDPLVIRHKQSLSARTFKSHAWRPMGAIVFKQNSKQTTIDQHRGHICRERPWRPNSGHLKRNSSFGENSNRLVQMACNRQSTVMSLPSECFCTSGQADEMFVEDPQLKLVDSEVCEDDYSGDSSRSQNDIQEVIEDQQINSVLTEKSVEQEFIDAVHSNKDVQETLHLPEDINQIDKLDIKSVSEQLPMSKQVRLRFNTRQQTHKNTEDAMKKELEEKMAKFSKHKKLLENLNIKDNEIVEPSLKDHCLIHYQDPFEFICRANQSQQVPYEYHRALPMELSKGALKELSRQGQTWRQMKDAQTIEMSHLEEEMLDRIQDIIKWELQTEFFERGKRELLRCSVPIQGTDKSTTGVINTQQPSSSSVAGKNRNCCRTCLQPACAGDCPNKLSRPRVCKTCRQIYCYGTCHKTGFVHQERDFSVGKTSIEEEDFTMTDKSRKRVVRPLSCESCSPKKSQSINANVNIIKSNEILLRKPRVSSATFSHAMHCSSSPIDLRRTCDKSKTDVHYPIPLLLLQEFERAQISPYRPSRPTSAATGRNTNIPGKRFTSNRKVSLKPPSYLAHGSRIRSATVRPSYSVPFIDFL